MNILQLDELWGVHVNNKLKRLGIIREDIGAMEPTLSIFITQLFQYLQPTRVKKDLSGGSGT